MIIFLKLLVAILCATADPGPLADQIAALPDVKITRAQAIEHAWSARVVGAVTGESPARLIALGWHESRLTSNVVAQEAGGRVSCGVMTPTPVEACHTTPLVAQYLTGALHVREWLDATHGDRHIAMIGVAGGYRLIAACARGAAPARGCHYAELIDAIATRLESRGSS